MDQYLIASITKSHIKEVYVKGPSYNLDLVSTQKIVGFLKSRNLWNSNFLFETNAFIDTEELFEKLGVFDPCVHEESYRYSLGFGDIMNYFTLGFPPYNEGYQHLGISARDKLNGKQYFMHFLDRNYHALFIEKFYDALGRDGKVKLDLGDLAQIKVDRDVNYFYEFNFSKYNHFLEFADPWNFIISPGDEWMALQEDTI